MAERFDLPSFSASRGPGVRGPRTTSFAVISANRQNAQRSTGPRTPAGKAKAARNSRRHGLSVSVLADPALAREVEACARRIAGDGASAARHELALGVAEAEIDLARIARVHAELAARQAAGHDVEEQLLWLRRYERRAQFRHQLAVEDLAAAISGGRAEQNKVTQNEADRQGGRVQSEATQNEADRQGGRVQSEATQNEANCQNCPR